MHLIPTPIDGVFEAETTPVGDKRGRLARLFCQTELRTAHEDRPIVQINHTLTRQVGTVRGMHFQHPPHAEAKWVRCLRGRVFDVALDLRHGSPTFLQWHACELDAGRQNALFIPEGCAHGFQTLAADSELLYLHTAAYAAHAEGSVRYDDPRIGIAWPLAVTDVSDRDRRHALLDDTFQGLTL
jgi:dTDP-4-dehydrorhamnose 3,5-epimerase